MSYVSLHNYTHFSILYSLISPKDIFYKAKEMGHTAVGITDLGTIAGVWDCLKYSKETGVKLIIGCEFNFVNDLLNKEDGKFRHVILLAKNEIGYKNLLTINKIGFDNGLNTGKKVYPVIDWNILETYKEGLICLTSGGTGIISQLIMSRNYDEAKNQIQKLQNIFGENLALEVQANTLTRRSGVYNDNIDQKTINFQIIKLAKEFNVKLIATSNSLYLNKEDADKHDVLLAIGLHQPKSSGFRTKYDPQSADFYFKSESEIKSFFERNFPELAEEMCSNTQLLADMCEFPNWIDPKYSNPSGKELPIFPIEQENDYSDFLSWKEKNNDFIINLEKYKSDEDKLYLRFKCKNSLSRLSFDDKKIYEDRLEEELDVIEYRGFSSYMLIVADYVNWARNNNISVGPGRGSVGGSLVAYLLGIHQADPIKYGLIFARFQNKEKTAYPDIDLDFSPSGRELVQNYLRQKYGNDRVAHVSNVMTITPKVYARDIARTCEFGNSKEDAVKIGTDIADSLPKEATSINGALEKIPLFSEYAKRYPALKDYADINGKYRAWATHAGGIVISQRPLTGLVPIRKDKDGVWALEYDKERAEENGLIKMDILGLSTLDIIDQTHNLIKAAGKEIPKINYSEYDKETYDLISNGDTFCVFQLGTSAGTIDLCRKIKPKSIEDISHINSLARPSARDIREDFVATKEGKKPVSIMHSSLNRAFGSTYGFGLYEESLMYLAQDVAGWSLHEADRLRKLTKEKGSKGSSKAEQWRKEFIEGAVKNNINELIATKVWDEVVSKFSGYGFNLSHSVLYSMISYQTAYLKAHYPIEFLMANLMEELKSNSPDAPANIEKIKKEIKKYKVKILPPNINKSDLHYKLIESNKLLTGLSALKFVSDDAIEDIISKRPFNSFFDFMLKVDSRKVRANTIQALASAGCFDDFGVSRKLIFYYCQDYRKKLQTWVKKHDPKTEQFNYPWPDNENWQPKESYALEVHYLGESFTYKKHNIYSQFFNDSETTPLLKVKKMNDRDKLKSVKGEIKDFVELKVKKEESKYYGKVMVKALIEDMYGEQCYMTIFPDKWEEVQKRIKELNKKYKFDVGCIIHMSATINNYEDENNLILNGLYNFIPPPELPSDLKARKVLMKREKSEKKVENNGDDLFENLESDLIDDGLIDEPDEF